MLIRKKFLALVVLFCGIAIYSICPAQNSFADSEENELFLVAQKAFDDGFYDVAARYVEQFLEKYPQTEKRAQANLLLGQCHFFKGQYLKAFDIFQGLLASPELKDATLYWLGETYLKGADLKQAEKQYRQLIEVYPTSFYAPQAYYSLGWTLYDQKDYGAAKDIFSQFMRKYPAHELTEDSLFKIAECEHHLRDYENSVTHFKDYLTRFTQSARQDQAYFYIAESFYYLENFPQALEYYTKASQISNDNKILLTSKISIGWCYFKLKDFEKSKQAFEEANTFSQEKNIPSDDIDLGKATLFFEMADYPHALEAYNHLIATFTSSPRLPEAQLGKANSLYLLKNYADAATEFKSVIEKFAATAGLEDIIEKSYFGLAWSYLKNNQTDLAIQTLRDVTGKSTNKDAQVSALTQIGDAYQDAGDLNKALETYDQILKDFPDSLYADYVQYRQGIALLKLNKIDAATISFQTLQTNFPTSRYLKDVKYYLGMAYYKKGDWAATREQLSGFLEGLAETNEFQADALYMQGVSTFNLQDYAEALKIFQKIVKNFPDQTSLVSNCEINIAKCLFNLDDAKEAVKRLKIVVYKYPKTDAELESLLWLGDYYLKSSDFSNAITYYQQLIEFFPGSEKTDIARYGLGQAYEEQGTLDKALSEYKSIRDSADQELYAKAQLSIADIFAKDIDSDAAVEAYRKITATSPEFSRDAFFKIAETLQGNESYDEALTNYEDALKTEKGSSKISNAQIQFSISDLKEITNKTQEAIDSYLKIPYLYPDEKDWGLKAYLRLGRIFEKEEDWENAKLIYNKIIEFQTEETKFAQERLDWIKNNIEPFKKR